MYVGPGKKRRDKQGNSMNGISSNGISSLIYTKGKEQDYTKVIPIKEQFFLVLLLGGAREE